MITQTLEYALRATVFLAQRSPSPATTEEIAANTKVPQAYLSKVLQSLGRHDIVRSQRGLHGGFALTKIPKHITILDVANAVEPIRRIRSCPLDLSEHSGSLCPLHRKLDNSIAAIEHVFHTTTIAEVLSAPGEPTPLCRVRMESVPQSQAWLPILDTASHTKASHVPFPKSTNGGKARRSKRQRTAKKRPNSVSNFPKSKTRT